MFEWMAHPQIWASLLTLTALEIVLGIDNVLFISILAGRLPPHQQLRARQIGLGLALIMRIGLLSMLTWIIGLKEPVFTAFDLAVSWRDIILLGGGLFLLAKATLEIHHTVEGEGEHTGGATTAAFGVIVGQIILLDVVFSLDSIITAVGMTDVLGVMIAAVIISIAVMLAVAGPVSAFVQRHPTVKMLALSFLLLIGMSLVAEGLHFHLPREYLYFAIAFSVLVEGLNLLVRRRAAKRAGAIPPVAPPRPGAPAGH